MSIRKRAEEAHAKAERHLQYLGTDCKCDRCAKARTDLEERRDLAAFVLRVTAPEMRERIEGVLRYDVDQADMCSEAGRLRIADSLLAALLTEGTQSVPPAPAEGT